METDFVMQPWQNYLDLSSWISIQNICTGRYSVSNEGEDDSSKCAMVSNEFNTWQIGKWHWKWAHFWLPYALFNWTKHALKISPYSFVLHAHVFWIWTMALRESNFISLFLSFCSTKRWVLWVSGEVLFSTLTLVHGQFHLLSPNLQCGYIIQT